MALAELLRALREQGAEHRAEELAEADARVAGIARDSATALERRRRGFLAEARRAEEDVAHRALSRSELEATRSTLQARDSLLARVRAALEERVGRADGDPAYLDVLPAELETGLSRLPAGQVVVRARPDSAERLAGAVRGREGARLEPVPGMAAGFSALAPESGVEVDGTLAARLEHAWPRLAVEVLKELAS